MYVYLGLDDRETHGVGCPCGLCNSKGISYGVAIYDMTPFGIYYRYQLSYWIQDALHQMDPLTREYGPDEEAAMESALATCEEHRWYPLRSEVPPEYSVHELVRSLDGLVGPDGYLTQQNVCECDTTHEQNHTVCRICWARYYYETFRLA